MCIWDAKSEEELRSFRAHKTPVCSVAFFPDGRVAALGVDENIRIWSSTGEEVGELEQEKAQTFSLAASGTVLAAGSDRTINVWDMTVTPPRIRGSVELSDRSYSLSLTNDGKYLAAACKQSITIWELSSQGAPKHLVQLDGHSDIVWRVRFSPDGKTVASASADRSVRLWDFLARDSKGGKAFHGHEANVYGLAFAPDGNVLVSCDYDGLVVAWDTESGATLKKWQVPNNALEVAIAPDGKTAAVSIGDSAGSIHLLQLPRSVDKR